MSRDVNSGQGERGESATGPKRYWRRAGLGGLLLAAIGAAIWWTGFVPYDRMAVMRPIPARATVVARCLALPEQWEGLIENPLVSAALRTAGQEPEDAAALTTDPESRRWFEKLAGQEGVLAWLPEDENRPPALVAVSWMGGQSQWLRGQLVLFRLPGFQRMATAFPDRAVWRVKDVDLPPGWSLTMTFGEGVLMACLSPSPYAIAELCAAYDGTSGRLLERSADFAAFSAQEASEVPERIWIRGDWPVPLTEDGTPVATANAAASETPAGRVVEVRRLDGDAMDVRAHTADLRQWADPTPAKSLDGLGRLLGDKPCATLTLRRSALRHSLQQLWLRGHSRHLARMVLEVAGDSVTVALLEGDYGGRLTWGFMRKLGMSGLRVPTVLAATPISDEASARAAIGRVLDSSNARYRGAFVLHPRQMEGGVEVLTLESAGGDEWVDELAASDRPSYALVNGWLLACSNRDALEKMLKNPPDAAASLPPWAVTDEAPLTARFWMELDRTGKAVGNAVAMWMMAQRFMQLEADPAVQTRLDNLRSWIDALRPFGEGVVEWRSTPDGDASLWSACIGPASVAAEN